MGPVPNRLPEVIKGLTSKDRINNSNAVQRIYQTLVLEPVDDR